MKHDVPRQRIIKYQRTILWVSREKFEKKNQTLRQLCHNNAVIITARYDSVLLKDSYCTARKMTCSKSAACVSQKKAHRVTHPASLVKQGSRAYLTRQPHSLVI